MRHQTLLLVSLVPLGPCLDLIFTVLPLAGPSHHRFIAITPCAIYSEFHPHPPSLTSNDPSRAPVAHSPASASVVISLRYHRHRSPLYAHKKRMITYHLRGCLTPFNVFTLQSRSSERLDVSESKRKWKLLV
ncbi:hypothetical protein BJ165DRAFT_1501443 [Panaeolus papilionaceus]|nr:hypothetical protein BJ165DRAFT_1501443 [Panaeolus papilionaceus]